MSMKLSEAILSGCKIAPIKAVGSYIHSFDDKCGSCALGAAYIGYGGPLRSNSPSIERSLVATFPILGAFRLSDFANEIIRKNDRSPATREEIAADLAAQGY